jgi:hypothetical protein
MGCQKAGLAGEIAAVRTYGSDCRHCSYGPLCQDLSHWLLNKNAKKLESTCGMFIPSFYKYIAIVVHMDMAICFSEP